MALDVVITRWFDQYGLHALGLAAVALTHAYPEQCWAFVRSLGG